MTEQRLELDLIERGGEGRAAVHLVKVNGQVIGMLEKYPNTRTERHPWKAFAGYGRNRRFLGAFYEDKDLKRFSVGDKKDAKGGGRDAAVIAIEVATGWYGG